MLPTSKDLIVRSMKSVFSQPALQMNKILFYYFKTIAIYFLDAIASVGLPMSVHQQNFF